MWLLSSQAWTPPLERGGPTHRTFSTASSVTTQILGSTVKINSGGQSALSNNPDCELSPRSFLASAGLCHPIPNPRGLCFIGCAVGIPGPPGIVTVNTSSASIPT